MSLIGSTGSIGTQAIEVMEACPERFEVVALGAHRSVDQLVAQAGRLHPKVVAIGDPTLAAELTSRLDPSVEVVVGTAGLAHIATLAQVAVNGVVGFAGLLGDAGRPRRRPAPGPGQQGVDHRRGAAGPAVPADPGGRADPGGLRALRPPPVPAGRCARRRGPAPADRLGWAVPWEDTAEELAAVSVADALAHPTWSMGPKITVDSSTLMNKGLEVIEAHELFGVPYDAIDVVVHPQSIVHSMVEFVDGAAVAQLSMPDMRLPIGYALAYPDRLPVAFGAIDWTKLSALEFEEPDRGVFPCLDLAYRAGRVGDLAPAWLNAANEVAVAAFLDERIGWSSIAEVVEATLDRYEDRPRRRSDPGRSVDDVLEADAAARRVAERVVAGREAA